MSKKGQNLLNPLSEPELNQTKGSVPTAAKADERRMEDLPIDPLMVVFFFFVMKFSELSFSGRSRKARRVRFHTLTRTINCIIRIKQQYTSPKAHRHLHEEIPNHSSKSDAYVSVSDEHKAEAILFLIEGKPKAPNQREASVHTKNPSKEASTQKLKLRLNSLN